MKNLLRVKWRVLSAVILMVFFSLPLMSQVSLPEDEKINLRVEEELLFQKDIPSHLIDSETKSGFVTLSGSVDNLLAKERAADVAKNIRGVKSVINMINVGAAPRADILIQNDIKDALVEDPATESYEVTINVINGKVDLKGEVDSWQEKELCGYVAKRVAGVRALENNIKVLTKEKRSDYDILTDIQAAFDNHIRLQPNNLTAKVNNGFVYLSGAVGSLRDRDLAERLSWMVGVKGVSAQNIEVMPWYENPNLKAKRDFLRTDKEIENAILKAFIYDPRIKGYHPNVRVEAGLVTLTGKVNHLLAKQVATSDARNVVGVKKVKNFLKVRPAHIPSDETLVLRLLDAYKRDVKIDAADLNIRVQNGLVSLYGTVDAAFQKYEAEEIAARTKGVVAIDNKIKIDGFAYQHPMPVYVTPFANQFHFNTMISENDYEIKTQVKEELWWSPFVNENEVEVSVNKGVVVLKGEVSSIWEREMAIQNAYEGGAREVINELSVEVDSQ